MAPDGAAPVRRAAVTELALGALAACRSSSSRPSVAGILSTFFPVQPDSPLPPAGDHGGLLLNLVAGAIIAPIGEELLFRGFATTAWARDLGPRRALVQGALFFAVVHVLTITGGTAGGALGLAVIGFVARLPVALALGWLFVERRLDLGADRPPRGVQRHPARPRRGRAPERLGVIRPSATAR